MHSGGGAIAESAIPAEVSIEDAVSRDLPPLPPLEPRPEGAMDIAHVGEVDEGRQPHRGTRGLAHCPALLPREPVYVGEGVLLTRKRWVRLVKQGERAGAHFSMVAGLPLALRLLCFAVSWSRCRARRASAQHPGAQVVAPQIQFHYPGTMVSKGFWKASPFSRVRAVNTTTSPTARAE